MLSWNQGIATNLRSQPDNSQDPRNQEVSDRDYYMVRGIIIPCQNAHSFAIATHYDNCFAQNKFVMIVRPKQLHRILTHDIAVWCM